MTRKQIDVRAHVTVGKAPDDPPEFRPLRGLEAVADGVQPVRVEIRCYACDERIVFQAHFPNGHQPGCKDAVRRYATALWAEHLESCRGKMS